MIVETLKSLIGSYLKRPGAYKAQGTYIKYQNPNGTSIYAQLVKRGFFPRDRLAWIWVPKPDGFRHWIGIFDAYNRKLYLTTKVKPETLEALRNSLRDLNVEVIDRPPQLELK